MNKLNLNLTFQVVFNIQICRVINISFQETIEIFGKIKIPLPDVLEYNLFINYLPTSIAPYNQIRTVHCWRMTKHQTYRDESNANHILFHILFLSHHFKYICLLGLIVAQFGNLTYSLSSTIILAINEVQLMHNSDIF